MKYKKMESQKKLEKEAMDKASTQRRAPGEIQGLSKHFKKNKGQGRGQRVKAQQ